MRSDDGSAGNREKTLGRALEARGIGGALTPPDGVDVPALYREHAAFLLRVAVRLTGDRAAAEDIVQEAFIVAHRRRRELRSGPEVRGWLYRVVAHLVKRHRRGFSRRRRLGDALEHVAVPPQPAADEVIGERQACDRVRGIVLRLPFREREVFALYELDEMSGPDIAALLGVAEGTVWSRLSAARRRFRQWATEGGAT